MLAAVLINSLGLISMVSVVAALQVIMAQVFSQRMKPFAVLYGKVAAVLQGTLVIKFGSQSRESVRVTIGGRCSTP